jgi:glycosyltransferase involved in cell wall biosynthesis
MKFLVDLPVVLDIIGVGYDQDACRKLASEIGVADRINFHGRVPRLDSFYRAADIFVFPSYREGGGQVVVEAMGYGLPLVVCNRGGPSYTVDDTCGLRVPALNPQQFANDLARAIRGLAGDRDRRLSLGEGARRRVANIGLWPHKIDQMDALYSTILGAKM